MVDRKRWDQSLRKARALLRPEARSRQRAAADRAAAEQNRRRAKLKVARMLERERALSAINKKLDELEEVASWLLYGKSRGARYVSNPYTTRLIWPTKGRTQYDIDSARSRARNILLRLEEMILFKHPPLAIWRLAIHCRGLALAGDDPVVAQNAREIADRFAPRKRHSLAQRIAIHRKAAAMVANHTPLSPSSQKKRYTKTDAKFRKLAALIDKLRARTTARGCTAQEAKTARDVVFDMLRGNRCRDTGLSPAELERFRVWYSRHGS